MNWQHFAFCFFCGMFLANAAPHLMHGVSGDRFPTPLAKPAGQGLSSPMTNTFWGLFNLAVGLILFLCAGKFGGQCNYCSLAVFFAGVAVMSIFSSWRFATKHKE